MSVPLVVNPQSQVNSWIVVARIDGLTKLLHGLVVAALGVVSYRQIEVRFITTHAGDPQRIGPQRLTIPPVADLPVGQRTQRRQHCQSWNREAGYWNFLRLRPLTGSPADHHK